MNNTLSDTILEVDIEAILHNFKLLSAKAGNAVCSAVVKANAYGLGVEKVAPALYGAGCRNFFVATLPEGIELAGIVAPDTNIYVFHGVKGAEDNHFYDHGLIPVINDLYQLDIWIKKAQDVAHKLPCILHFDTGMNRLGINHDLAEKVANYDNLKMLDIKYIMSHLVNGEELEHPINASQFERFLEVKKYFPRHKMSLANSWGILAGEKFLFNMVRPGCALYGVKGDKALDIKQVFKLRSKIIQIRELTEDGSVGYGATASAKAGARLAVVPVGYADGYLRNLSNRSHAFFDTYKLPLVGRVSMDLCIFDISAVPADKIKPGDHIELIGNNYNVDEIAKDAGTIGYEILTSLGCRYNVVYKNSHEA